MPITKSSFTILLFLGWLQIHAQCLLSSIPVCPTDTVTFTVQNPPTGSCQIQSDCAGLVSGHLLVSYPDTMLVGAVDTNVFIAANYDSCISVVPFCFDILAVQAFVDALHISAFCCSQINNAIPGACDSIKSRFSSGSEIQGLEDFTNVFNNDTAAKSTLRQLAAGIEAFNAQSGLISLVCPGAGAIAFCLDTELDFNARAYQITSTACGFADCVDTISITPSFLAADPHQSIFKAMSVVLAQGIVTAGNLENLEFRAGTEVSLSTDFQVQEGATLEIIIEDCEISTKRQKSGFHYLGLLPIKSEHLKTPN